MTDMADINSKYTFWKLLSEYKVVIPIIQRDYAQGRLSDSASAIREELLECIYNALMTEEGLDFDFVYGTVEGDTLYPLDGQQRLTTFYLLHWYLAQKENRMEDAVPVLSNFSYETRVSSREFCALLMQIDYEPVEGVSVSSYIKNENGYFKAWDTDPTISHMLTMLDAIHEKFFYTEELFELLTAEEYELLTFNYLPMEHYALTDDLYIKMNARGKALSIFENFKAKFIQHMKECGLPYDHFEESIDGRWTDLLWDYRDYDNTIDDQFMNLFCYITEMLYLEVSEPREGDSPFRPSRIKELIDFYDDKEYVDDLYSYLDLWKDKNEASECLTQIFTTDNEAGKVMLFEGETDIFSSIINGESVSLANKLVLFAVMKRLVYVGKDADIEGLKDYARIVRNFLLNTRSFIRKRCSFTPDLRFGRHAIPIMQNFIDFLVDEDDIYQSICDYEFSDINADILALEIQKARIILDDPMKKQLVHGLEDLNLFRSSIFNVIPYIQKSTDTEHLVGNLDALSNCDSPKIIQALLSIKDYGIRVGSSAFGDRFFYGCVDNWYSVFTYNDGEKYAEFISDFVEQYESTESEKVSDCMDEIITENLGNIKKDDWRYTIVKYYNTVKMWKNEIDQPYMIFAKETCSDGSIVMHRTNSFIMNSWHVVPEYLEIREQLGDLCWNSVRSYGCDEEYEGAVKLKCVANLCVSFNSNGGFDISRREEDVEWVSSTIEKYDSIKSDDMDKVERCVLLCKMLDEKSNEVYGATSSDVNTSDDSEDDYEDETDMDNSDNDEEDDIRDIEAEDTTESYEEEDVDEDIDDCPGDTALYKDFLMNLFGTEKPIPEDMDAIFREQVNSLPHEKAKTVIWKMWREGKRAQEIANEMNVTTSYVYNLRDRGLRMLRHPTRSRWFAGIYKRGVPKTYDSSTSIDELELSVKTYNNLMRAGLRTIGDITAMSKRELKEIRNFGSSSLEELLKKLKEIDVEIQD